MNILSINEVTMIMTTKRKSVIKFNKIKGTRVVSTNHDIHKLSLCHLAIVIFLNLPDGLVVYADRYEHPSRCFELVDKCFRKLLRCSTNMDSIVGAYTKIKVISKRSAGRNLPEAG